MLIPPSSKGLTGIDRAAHPLLPKATHPQKVRKGGKKTETKLKLSAPSPSLAFRPLGQKGMPSDSKLCTAALMAPLVTRGQAQDITKTDAV